MSAFHEALKKIFTVVDGFINSTLKTESLSKTADKERLKLLELLQKFYSEYEYLNPSNADEGSSSSSKDALQDESRNTLGSNNSNEDDQYEDDIPDTTVKALTDPIKYGYLQKKRTDFLGMLSKQKCYCVLHKNAMYWFKKPGHKKQQGAFFVTGYECREVPQSEKDIQRKEFPFELICTAKKTYQFIAESKEDLDSWKQAVVIASKYVVITPSAIDSEIIDFEDVYEPIDEVSEQVKKSLNQQEPKRLPDLPAQRKFHVPELDENDEPIEEDNLESVYDAAESETVNSGKTSHLPASKSQPSQIQLPTVKYVKDEIEDVDEDLIYEAVDNESPHMPDTRLSIPASPPPLPPHNPTTAPAEQVTPPPLPSRGLTFATSDKVSKELPPIPQKKRTLTLGNVILSQEDYENMYYGMWKCIGSTENELSFDEGDVIHVINTELDAENWWIGELKGSIGLVPKPFLCPAYEVAA